MAQPTPDMLVDVVDSRDRKVGVARRRDVLSSRSGFRVAHVFVFNEAGDLLLQQLAPTRDRHPLRFGSSVAAYLFADESYEAAAHRRIQQELAVRPRLRFRLSTSMLDSGCTKWIHLFDAVHPGPFQPDPGHIADVQFVALGAVDQLVAQRPADFTPTFVNLFNRYKTLAP